MLSRAVLPLARPNLLASPVRISAIQHPRWYAKNNSPKQPYKIPESLKSRSKQPGQRPREPGPQKEYSADQAEFDTNADPANNTASRTSETVSRFLTVCVVY